METQEEIVVSTPVNQEPVKVAADTPVDFYSSAVEPGVISRYLQCCDCV